MPNIVEMKQILKYTPIDQAIMLVGIHGIGKSEFLRDYYEEQGFGVITLFLGQMADSGDLIGLPNRTEVEFTYNGKSIKQSITEFCPPKWWPRKDDAKIVIFMDEFNRSKPEVYQCVFDMVLNRKLNGLPLPKQTRIVAAMNPSGDEYDYDVTELDPALLDRFNVYQFHPDTEEWLNWAMTNKVNKYVIGFVNKNRQFLDPPDAKSNNKIDKITPSRRSWKRVSDILNHSMNLINDNTTFKTIMIGIIGEGGCAKFAQYIKESARSISGAKIVTGWDKTVEHKIKEFTNQDLVYLNKEIAIYLETQEVVLFDAGKKEAQKYGQNVEKYLKTAPKEILAEFMDHVTTSYQQKKTWGEKLLNSNEKGLVDFFVDIIQGKTIHDKEVDDMVKQSDTEGKDWSSGDSDIDDIINGGPSTDDLKW